MGNYVAALTITSWSASILTVKIFIKEDNEHRD